MTRAYQVNKQTGCLDDVSFFPSPNHNARPQLDDISVLVIHGISLPPGEFGGDWITRLFMNQIEGSEHPSFAALKGLEVSSHLLIRRTGEVIQYVPFTQRAWHAGVSSFEGRDNCNDYSIGIELEGTDTVPYEAAQYESLSAVTQAICVAYPQISLDRIVGHCDIAPGRKTDPGPVFDWDQYKNTLFV